MFLLSDQLFSAGWATSVVWVLEVVLADRPASVLKEVSAELVLVVVTPDSEVTEVLTETCVLPLKDTRPRAMAISTVPVATIAIIFFLLPATG